MSQGIVDVQVTSNCWICEGWTQVQFKFNPSDLAQSTLEEMGEINDSTFCYLHLSIDEYKGDLMEKSENGQFNLMRMVPPKKVEYYFSLVNAPLAKQDKSQFSSTFMEKKAIVVPGTNYIDLVIQRKSLIYSHPPI